MRSAEQNQRLSHHAGQLLTARDLQDDVSSDARMRGLHVRALHGVWGVALGYEILSGNNRFLQVTQGMAYDCAGREIVMSETLQVELAQAPRGSTATVWWFDFLIRYNSDLLASGTSDRYPEIGLCVVPERPIWRWSYAGDAETPFIKSAGFADDVRLGEEIPLVRVRITEKGTWTDLDLTVRRVARSLARPHIVTGQVRANTIAIQGSPLRWTAEIDTAAGGFNTSSPFYFVTFAEHPLLSPTSGFADITNRLTDQQKSQLLGPLTRVKETTRTGFILDVRTATGNKDLFASLPVAFRRQVGFTLPVPVNWLGIEPHAESAPP